MAKESGQAEKSQTSQNTEFRTIEPQVAVGGDKMTSFDDIEAAMGQKLDEETPEGKKAMQEGQKEDSKETRNALKQAVTDDLNKKKSADSKSQGQESDDDVGEGEEGQEETEAQKLIRLKDGDKELELNSQSHVPVKIDGKTEYVPVQELINNYSGKVVYDRKFSELDRERKKVEELNQNINKQQQMIADINKEINTIHELAMSGDPKKAIHHLAEVMGANPIKLWRELEEKIETNVSEKSELSQEEREAQRYKEELEYERRLREKQAEKSNLAKKEQDFERRCRKVMTEKGMTEAEFVQMYDELAKDPSVAKDLTMEKIPELVSHQYESQVSRKMAEGVLSQVQPNMEGEDKENAVNDLLYAKQTWEQMNKGEAITEADLLEIASNVWGNEKAKKVSKKLKQTKPENTGNPSKERQESPMFFEDIL